MKAFHFPLETALAWRKTRLETEESALARLAAEQERLRAEALQNREDGARAERDIAQASAATALDLWALDGYRQAVRMRARALEDRLRAAAARLAAQRARVEQARREFRLLENLKHRRRAEWQREADREIENFAGDSYLARWNREARRAARANANPHTAAPGGKAPR